jgi:hypothetical protein
MDMEWFGTETTVISQSIENTSESAEYNFDLETRPEVQTV